MRLLYLMTEPFGIGGVQSDILALSEDLVGRGHEIYVATTPGILLNELESCGAWFFEVDFHYTDVKGFMKAALALRRIIKTERIEIVAPQSVRSTLVGYFGLRALPFGALRANSMFVTNLEYHFPLGTFIKELGEVQGIVFADIGNAPIRFTDVRIGYGVGVSLKTPIGPIRLDVAFGQGSTQTWIVIGSPF